MFNLVFVWCLWVGGCEPPTYAEAVVHELSATTTEYVPPAHSWPPLVEQWRPLVAGQFPPEAVETMLCLMMYESGGKPTADNPNSTARGLMQVLRGWADHFGVTYEDLYDPSINLWISRQLYDDNTYWHWSPYVRGLCRGL